MYWKDCIAVLSGQTKPIEAKLSVWISQFFPIDRDVVVVTLKRCQALFFQSFTGMAFILVTHDKSFSKNCSQNLFCDAKLTKDGVTLIPVHKIVLASFSSKFKKIFEGEDQRDGLTIVPVVDFTNLKRVINFIYDGEITLHSKGELDDFLDAMSVLKVV